MMRELITGYGIEPSHDGLYLFVYVILESGLKSRVTMCQTYEEARSSSRELFNKYQFASSMQTSAQI